MIEDNYIDKDIVDGLDLKIRNEYKKAEGWLPFEAYDMVQCGYPYPDHGEMVLRPDGGNNSKNELLPSNGMWCKVKDAIKVINELKEKK